MALNKRVLLALMVLGSLAIAMAEEAATTTAAEPAKKKEDYGDDYEKHDKHKVRGEASRQLREGATRRGKGSGWLNWFVAISPRRHPVLRTFRYWQRANAVARLRAARRGTTRSADGLTADDGQQDSIIVCGARQQLLLCYGVSASLSHPFCSMHGGAGACHIPCQFHAGLAVTSQPPQQHRAARA